MCKFTSLMISLCISATILLASGEPKLTPEQQEVINAHNTLRDTARRRDFAAWSPHVADDCIFSTDDGEITTKAKVIDHMRNMPLAYDHSENQRDFTVRVGLRIPTSSPEMRETETFIRRGGSWLLVARQWGALPVNFRVPVAADPLSYGDYAGQYEWRPGGPVDDVSVKDGKLLTRLNEESEDHEYLPLGSGTFFIKDDLGTVTFVRNAQGRVRGYTYHRVDGQEVHVKKIK